MNYPKRLKTRTLTAILLAGAGACVALAAAPANAAGYGVTSLVTDDQGYLTSQGFGPAKTVDASLINPWGIAHAPGGAWFVANTGTEANQSGAGQGTFYTGAGAKLSTTVSVPEGLVPPNGPTGVVYNTSATGFNLPNGGHSQFIIASLDGSISAVAAGGSTATKMAQGPTPQFGPPHSIYTGLGIGVDAGQTYLYAANNGTGSVDIYNSSFQAVSLGAGAFVDPATAGLAPFNVQDLGGDIWVTYSIPGPNSDDAGLGSGAVAEYAPDGTLLRTLTSPMMSSPWALALAPSGFGKFSGDLLVGNFSHDDNGQTDAFINAFDPATGAFEGTLSGADGKPILLPGLWAIEAGDGGVSGSTNSLYFSAGIGDEQHGLFGSISAVPEPSAWALMIVGLGGLGGALRSAGRRRGVKAGAAA